MTKEKVTELEQGAVETVLFSLGCGTMSIREVKFGLVTALAETDHDAVKYALSEVYYLLDKLEDLEEEFCNC